MSYNSSDWFIRLLINISLMVAAEAKGEKEKNKINLHPCDSHMFGGTLWRLSSQHPCMRYRTAVNVSANVP